MTYRMRAARSLMPSPFLDETRITKKPKMHVAYAGDLGYLLEAVSCRHLEDLEQSDLLAYRDFCKQSGLSDRTEPIEFANVMTF